MRCGKADLIEIDFDKVGDTMNLVSRSQANKIRSLFLFVLDDDLLICSLISRAVVEPRYRISTLRSRENTKCSNFQTTMTSSNIFLTPSSLHGVGLKVQALC